jgi:hypothetical protein
LNDVGNGSPEARADLVGVRLGGLDGLMQDPSGHRRLVVTGVVQQRGHLDWMQHKRCLVGLAALPGVDASGKGESVTRERQRA